jgi:GTP-binding protein EngB required for normal cell division
MEIIYNDGKKISFNINEGKNILKEEEKKYLESKRYIKNLMKENKYDTSYKSILEEKFLYKSNISRINYFLDEKILDDFSIVDTPGLNQNLKLTTLNSMKDYYNMSDAILWLIDAQNIVAKKNNELINEIDEFAKIYGNNKNIIAVVNKIDTISLHGEKNLEKIKEKANQIYKDYFKDIVFISAKFKTNIDTLYESIDYNLKREILENKIKSKKASIYISKDKLLNLILKYKRNLYKSISIYNESNYNKSLSKTILDENFKMSHVSFENVDKLIFHLNNIQNIVCKRGWDFEQKY